MKSVITSSLVGLACVSSLGACAAGAISADREALPARAHVQLDLVPHPDTVQVIPAALSPQLPSVDRLASQVRARFGDAMSAAVDLCVSPEGRVTRAALVESKGSAALDAAIVHDAAAWQFAAMPGPAALRSCQRAQLTYHPAP